MNLYRNSATTLKGSLLMTLTDDKITMADRNLDYTSKIQKCFCQHLLLNLSNDLNALFLSFLLKKLISFRNNEVLLISKLAFFAKRIPIEVQKGFVPLFRHSSFICLFRRCNCLFVCLFNANYFPLNKTLKYHSSIKSNIMI